MRSELVESVMTRCSQISAIAALCVVMSMAAALSHAQQLNLPRLLSSDTAALISVDVDAAREWVRSLDWGDVNSAIAMLQEEPFPILMDDQAQVLLASITESGDLIGGVIEIYCIIHEWEDGQFPLLTFCARTDGTASRELLRDFWSRTQAATGAWNQEPVSGDTEAEGGQRGEGSPVGTLFRAFLDQFGQWKYLDIADGPENWVVVSNHAPFLARLEDRHAQQSERTLEDSRRYQLYVNSLRDAQVARRVLWAYVEPARAQPLMSWILPTGDWSAFRIHELPVYVVAAGFRANGTVIVDSFVHATVPQSGVAELWSTSSPVTHIPPMALDPRLVIAAGRNQEAYVNWHRAYYTELYGDATYETEMARYYGRSDNEFIEAFKQHTDTVVEVQAEHEGQTAHLVFYRVHDPDAMDQVVKARVQQQNVAFSDSGMQLTERVDGDARIWRYELPQSRNGELQQRTAHAIADGWYFTGSQQVVDKQFEYFVANRGMVPHEVHSIIPHGESWMIAELRVCRLTVHTARSLRHFANLMMVSRARERAGTGRFDQELLQEIAKGDLDRFHIESELDRMALIHWKVNNWLIDNFGNMVIGFDARPARFRQTRLFVRDGGP